jgi:hypothetical protein
MVPVCCPSPEPGTHWGTITVQPSFCIGRYEGTDTFLGRRETTWRRFARPMTMVRAPQYVCGAAPSWPRQYLEIMSPFSRLLSRDKRLLFTPFFIFRSVWCFAVTPIPVTPSAPRFACLWCRFFTAPVTLQDEGIGTCSTRRRPSRPLAHRAPANRRYPPVSLWQRGLRKRTYCAARQAGGSPTAPRVASPSAPAPRHRSLGSPLWRPTACGLTAEAGAATVSWLTTHLLGRLGSWLCRTAGVKPT